MRAIAIPLTIAGAIALSACSGMNTTEQRVLSGGAIGASTGVIVTAATGGCIACGAAIGAGVGALGGYIYDQAKKN